MDMLVKLYDLPDSRGSFERLRQRGIHIRRALTAEKHKVAAWVRENFAEGWAAARAIGRKYLMGSLGVPVERPRRNAALFVERTLWKRMHLPRRRRAADVPRSAWRLHLRAPQRGHRAPCTVIDSM